jgi:hypothetical protein
VGHSVGRKYQRDRGWNAASIAILVTLWTLAIIHLTSLAKSVQYKSFPCDFCSFYSSDLALRAGLDPYTADLPAIERTLGTQSQIPHATEPPTQLMLFAPFTYFSLPSGFWVWTALNVLALAASLGLLLGPRSGLNYRTALMLIALTILYPPVSRHFVCSQNKLFTLLTLVLMMRCMEDGYDGSAGLLLALAGLTRRSRFTVVRRHNVGVHGRREQSQLFPFSACHLESELGHQTQRIVSDVGVADVLA